MTRGAGCGSPARPDLWGGRPRAQPSSGPTRYPVVWSFALPTDPVLYGLRPAVQAIVGPTDGRLGVDLSNGLLLTIGL